MYLPSFNKNQVYGPKTHWRCSHFGKGCRAILHTLNDMTIVKYYNVHNHLAPETPLHQFKKITFTNTQQGGTIIVLSGNKFYKYRTSGPKIHWKCSRGYKHGCRAVIHTLQDMTVIKCHNVHNHLGPKYFGNR
ncbi:Uncharacterized protein OBRU01_15197 [Operophtera brumata]|uniref:FLYWCH-type domain-containing protein n=1 Tax=Operophtera brumata TaxID=104452 RepID=A0A0L7L5J7_OPEBR|nr:Uncharacterized protein OBRU01_15197 [Operophtera brumata]